MNITNRFALVFCLYRASVSILMIIHGITRLYLGTVPDFGGFLDGQGIPFGVAVAYGITAFEILGGLLLIFGKFPKWIATLFALELLFGIIMVHSKFGWFVVGHSSNGMEYNISLILAFLLIAAKDFCKTKLS